MKCGGVHFIGSSGDREHPLHAVAPGLLRVALHLWKTRDSSLINASICRSNASKNRLAEDSRTVLGDILDSVLRRDSSPENLRLTPAFRPCIVSLDSRTLDGHRIDMMPFYLL